MDKIDRILPSGIVEVRGERNGGIWRTTLAPGETERAGQLLDAKELALVLAAWTPPVLAAWQAAQPAPEPPVLTQPSRLDILEAALLDLADGKPLTPEQRAKLAAVRAR